MMNLLDSALASHAPKATHVVRLVDFWLLMEKLGLAALLIHGVLAPQVIERWKLSLLTERGLCGRCSLNCMRVASGSSARASRCPSTMSSPTWRTTENG